MPKPWCYAGHRWDDGVKTYCVFDENHKGDHKDRQGRTWENEPCR